MNGDLSFLFPSICEQIQKDGDNALIDGGCCPLQDGDILGRDFSRKHSPPAGGCPFLGGLVGGDLLCGGCEAYTGKQAE